MNNDFTQQLSKWLLGLENEFYDPVEALESFIDKIEDEVWRYKTMPNARQGYIDKRLHELDLLRMILEMLRKLPPLELWGMIGGLLQSHKGDNIDGIHLIIPMKPDPKPERLLMIDLSKTL